MKYPLINKITLTAFLVLLPLAKAQAQTDPLPSWNDGAAKKAIVEFVKTTTDKASSKFVPPEARIAVFDQDGTTWVEYPMYTQVSYCLDRVPAVVKAKPDLANVEPFKTVLSSNREAMANLKMPDLEMLGRGDLDRNKRRSSTPRQRNGWTRRKIRAGNVLIQSSHMCPCRKCSSSSAIIATGRIT
jgi:hypothetical protein